MIVGPDFVWLHFPKCAGTHVERVLRATFGREETLAFDPIDGASAVWHHNVDEREAAGADLSGRDIVCGFRRLPSWILSRIHFERTRSPHLLPARDLYVRGRFFERDGSEGWADDYVGRYTSRAVTRWIRVEHLREDFVAAFSPYLDVRRLSVLWRLRRRRNATSYRRDLGAWFTAAELEGLYESCPAWRDLERALYGGLVSL